MSLAQAAEADGPRRPIQLVSGALGLVFSFAALYIAGFGVFNEVWVRTGAVALALVIAVLVAPLTVPRKGALRYAARAVDSLLVVAAVVSLGWLISIADEIQVGLYDYTQADYAMAVVGLIALLELTRRHFGLPIFLFCVSALLYALFGEYLPGLFRHAGYTLDQILRVVWYSFDGVFGRPVAVVTSVVLVFIVFGVLLEGTGAGQILLRIAFVVTGRLRGGPAHAAVVASGLFGTMSGSAIANVVGTGVFTIPMIKRRGFSANFAAGVEAAASSGGQFMPPVMGAVAFIMADITGIPYLTIIVAALLPALFFYAALFCAISVEASRLNIQPLPPEERMRITPLEWLQSAMFVVPLIVIVGLLVSGWSAATAGFWAVWTAVGMGFVLNPQLRARPWVLISALARAGESCARIMVAVAAIGILIGVVNMTGLGLRFATQILALADDTLLLGLALMMLGSLVLGMGMPTVPAYLIIVIVMGRAIENLGVPSLIVHMFVLYFGVLSAITPPVALAAYAAAPIAGANPLSTAVSAVRLGLVGFIVPFVFVYNPSLVLVLGFEWSGLLWVIVRLTLAIWLLSTGLAGHDRDRLPLWSAVARIGLGIGVLLPDLWIETACLVGGTALVLIERQLRRKPPALPELSAADRP